jgi:membrane associated rhomboid family serine protease
MDRPVLDYEQRPPPSASPLAGLWQMASITTWLIAINVLVFLGEILFAYLKWMYIDSDLVDPRGIPYEFNPVIGLGHFSLGMMLIKGEVWRIITFQFIHAGWTHLILNMLGLFFFGPMVEEYFGRKKFLAFYLLCGVGGPIGYMALALSGFLAAGIWTPLMGASAGVFGILVAGAQIAPNATVLIYGILPMKLKTLAWVLMLIAAYTVLQYGGNPILGGQHNAGGEAGHLGGMAVGLLLFHNPHLLRFIDFDWGNRRRKPF